jgi:hypothetical protein
MVGLDFRLRDLEAWIYLAVSGERPGSRGFSHSSGDAQAGNGFNRNSLGRTLTYSDEQIQRKAKTLAQDETRNLDDSPLSSRGDGGLDGREPGQDPMLEVMMREISGDGSLLVLAWEDKDIN